MLAAEFALAVAPAAVGDDGGDARIGAARIDADCAAKARTDDCDAVRIDRRMFGKGFERVAGVFDLFEADNAAELAFTLAAAAHVKAHSDVTKVAEHLSGRYAG